MGPSLKLWAILLLIRLSHAGQSVDLLTSNGLNTLEEEEILRVLSRNQTTLPTNYSLIQLIGSLRNHTAEAGEDVWKPLHLEVQDTNPFYGEFRCVQG